MTSTLAYGYDIDLDTHAIETRHDQPHPNTLHLPDLGWDTNCDKAIDREQRWAAVAAYAVRLAARSDLIARRSDLAGQSLSCTCPHGQPCQRDVLLDLADPAVHAGRRYGRTYGMTIRRPWASLLLVPGELGGKTIENRTWSTQYRGPLLIIAGTRVDPEGVQAATAAGLSAAWHTRQQGWLGAAVLVDVHPARTGCCQPWGQQPRGSEELYHWVFKHPERLASPAYGTGFLGLRKVAWSNLIRHNALHQTTTPAPLIH